MGYIYLYLFYALLAIGLALLLEKRHRAHAPNQRPFTWGYFQGIAAILFGSTILVAGIADRGANASLAAVLLLLFWIVSGWLTLRRNRWAYVVWTVTSLNPILWIANGVYIRNRGHELRGSIELAPPREASVESPSVHSAERISGLERLAKLRDEGLLTDDEFQEQKRKLITP